MPHTVGCSGTALREILDPRVVEDAHARLAWTVHPVIHDEVMGPGFCGAKKDSLRTLNLNQRFP